MVRRSTIAILCGSAVLLAAMPAVADELRDRAAAAFDQGVNRFRTGDAEGALAAFEEAYRLVPNPAILYNIGQTELALHHEPRAYTALEQYLSAAAVSRARRTEVERTLRRLRPRIGALVLSVDPPDARVSVDGRAPEPVPPGGVVYLSPGRHRIAVRSEDRRTERREVEVRAGAERRIEVTLERERRETPARAPTATGELPRGPEPRPEPRAEERHGPPVATLVFGGAAVAAIAMGAVTGVMALGRQSEVDDARDAWRRGEPVNEASIEDTARTGETLALVTDVALGVAVVSATVAVLFWTSAGRGDEQPAVSAMLSPLRDGAVVLVRGPVP